MGTEGLFESGALRRVCKCGFGCLSSSFERVLAGDILGMSRFGGVQQVDTQLLFATRTTLEIERLRFVQFASDAGKHAV